MTIEAKQEETTAMDFLDEYWFFQNVLCLDRRRRPIDISSPSKPEQPIIRCEEAAASGAGDGSTSTRALVRAPSLPPLIEPARKEASPSKTSKAKLLRSCSAFDGHPSYSPAKTPRPGPRRRRSSSSRNPTTESSTSTISRSLSDLECLEVQGFRDLGFVFDKERADAELARVIPGLRPAESEGQVSRPYLSEAWVAQRSAPPRLRWGERGSTEDMKEQLRFWARAVAGNVRQEC